MARKTVTVAEREKRASEKDKGKSTPPKDKGKSGGAGTVTEAAPSKDKGKDKPRGKGKDSPGSGVATKAERDRRKAAKELEEETSRGDIGKETAKEKRQRELKESEAAIDARQDRQEAEARADEKLAKELGTTPDQIAKARLELEKEQAKPKRTAFVITDEKGKKRVSQSPFPDRDIVAPGFDPEDATPEVAATAPEVVDVEVAQPSRAEQAFAQAQALSNAAEEATGTPRVLGQQFAQAQFNIAIREQTRGLSNADAIARIVRNEAARRNLIISEDSVSAFVNSVQAQTSFARQQQALAQAQAFSGFAEEATGVIPDSRLTPEQFRSLPKSERERLFREALARPISPQITQTEQEQEQQAESDPIIPPIQFIKDEERQEIARRAQDIKAQAESRGFTLTDAQALDISNDVTSSLETKTNILSVIVREALTLGKVDTAFNRRGIADRYDEAIQELEAIYDDAAQDAVSNNETLILSKREFIRKVSVQRRNL